MPAFLTNIGGLDDELGFLKTHEDDILYLVVLVVCCILLHVTIYKKSCIYFLMNLCRGTKTYLFFIKNKIESGVV